MRFRGLEIIPDDGAISAGMGRVLDGSAREIKMLDASSCPMCLLPETLPDTPAARRYGWDPGHTSAASVVWDSWDGQVSSAPSLVRLLQELALDPDEVLTPRIVSHHFIHHRLMQPVPSKRMRTDEVQALLLSVSPRLRAVVELVFRLRVGTTAQIAAALYIHAGGSQARAERRCREDLNHLARLHLLYRYYIPAKDPARSSGDAAWFVGPRGSQWLNRTHGRPLSPNQFVRRASDVKPRSLPHDLGVGDLVAHLGRCLRERSGLGPQLPAALWLAGANWYGARGASLGFWDRYTQNRRTVQPDAFCTVSVDMDPRLVYSPDAGDLPGVIRPSLLLPTWVEYDRGSRKAVDVAEQILSYHYLLASSSVQERFPDLNVDGYAVPMVMVFERPEKIRPVLRRMHEIAAELNLERDTPLYVTSAAKWRSMEMLDDQFLLRSVWSSTPATRDALDADAEPEGGFIGLLQMLLLASAPLTASGRVDSQLALRHDPKGGYLPVDTIRRVEAREAQQLKAGAAPSIAAALASADEAPTEAAHHGTAPVENSVTYPPS